MRDQLLNTQSVLSMRGAGYYSERTRGAKMAIDSLSDMMSSAVEALPHSPHLRFADFGAADGGTSVQMWHRLLKMLRDSGDNRAVEMIYTDLPSNDFSTLFKTMQGMGAEDAHAYQNQFENVFVHGCGTGFHTQLMADNSLHLGFSATAMHYVSEIPCHIADHVHMVGASEMEKQAFARQAALDWERILCARAAELAPGGRLIVMNFGIDDEGRYLGNTGGENMFSRFTAHWKNALDENRITQDEFVAASFAQHYRTVEEFAAPFRSDQSAVRKAGLNLLSIKTQITPCPYRHAFDTQDDMDAQTFAASLIPTMRSWSETVFRTALAGRQPAEIDEITDRFYADYQAEIAQNPDGHAMDYVHIIMEIEKQR